VTGRIAPPPLSAHTSEPLAVRQTATEPHCTRTSDAQARVLQPVPATIPALQIK